MQRSDSYCSNLLVKLNELWRQYRTLVRAYNRRKCQRIECGYQALCEILKILEKIILKSDEFKYDDEYNEFDYEVEMLKIFDCIEWVKPRQFSTVGLLSNIAGFDWINWFYYRDYFESERIRMLEEKSCYVVYNPETSFIPDQSLIIGFESCYLIAIRTGNFRLLDTFPALENDEIQNEFSEENLIDKSVKELRIYQFCSKFSGTSCVGEIKGHAADFCFKFRLMDFDDIYNFFLENLEHFQIDELIYNLIMWYKDVSSVSLLIKAGHVCEALADNTCQSYMTESELDCLYELSFLSGNHEIECNFITKPLTLKNTARYNVRNHMRNIYEGRLYRHNLRQLPLPALLISFLEMNDVIILH